MSYENLKSWRQKTKQMLVEGFGGRCNRCGYDTSVSALDFHHVDPSTKEYTISNLLKNPTNRPLIIQEVKKCILLCRNCHAEYHDGVWSIDDIVIKRFDTSHLDWSILKEQRSCLYCDALFIPTHKNHKYCTKDCHNKVRTSKNKPNKKLMKKLVWSYPMTKLAQQFQVSDKTIAKWADSYGITRPPRGYFL